MESVKRLKHLITGLDDREKKILKMRFGLDGENPVRWKKSVRK